MKRKLPDRRNLLKELRSILDAQTAAARDLDALKQSVARLAAAQADADTRLGKLESGQALLASRLDAATRRRSGGRLR